MSCYGLAVLVGSFATAIITRDRFPFIAPFEQKSVVFDPLRLDQHSEYVSFFVPRDNIVELMEFFAWRLSVNDSRVMVGRRYQVVRVNSDDGKQLIIQFS